jgi:hypothetical protein
VTFTWISHFRDMAHALRPVPCSGACCALTGPVFCLVCWVPVDRLDPLSRAGLCVVVIFVRVNGEKESRISESIMRATWWNPEWDVEGLEDTELRSFKCFNLNDEGNDSLTAWSRANICSASQTIIRPSWKLKIHYRVHKETVTGPYPEPN